MSDVTLSAVEFEQMLDRAARKGAKEALASLGLHDSNAADDIRDIRSLLESWRETRKAMWSTTVQVVTGAFLMFIAGAVYLYVKQDLSK